MTSDVANVIHGIHRSFRNIELSILHSHSMDFCKFWFIKIDFQNVFHKLLFIAD